LINDCLTNVSFSPGSLIYFLIASFNHFYNIRRAFLDLLQDPPDPDLDQYLVSSREKIDQQFLFTIIH